MRKPAEILVFCIAIILLGGVVFMAGCENQKMANEERNKAIVLRFTEEGWNKGNLEVFDEIYATDFVYRDPAFPNVSSLADYKGFVSRVVTSYSDMHYTIEDMISEGDKVVVCYTFRGTRQKGEFQGIPLTGKRVAHPGIAIYRFSDDKIVELQDIWNALDVYRQFGFKLVPQQE